MPSRKFKKKQKKRRAPVKGPFLCYVIALENTDCVYTGQTNNWTRRFRQHKGKIKGGARYTRRSKTNKRKTKAGCWKPLFHVCGFDRLRHVLQFEIAMKKRYVPRAFMRMGKTRARGKNKTKAKTRGPKGRLRQLEYILSLGQLRDDEPATKHTGLYVKCFMSKETYLKRLGMSNEAFEQLRIQQQVPFVFDQ